MPDKNKPRYHVKFILKEKIHDYEKERVELDFHSKRAMQRQIRNALIGGGLHLDQGTAKEAIYPSHMIKKIVVEDRGKVK